MSSIRFSQLRRLLLDLHFRESRKNTYWRFEHPESDTIFVFRPYAEADPVTMRDVAATRTHLDWRGLPATHSFDDRLTTTPRAENLTS